MKKYLVIALMLIAVPAYADIDLYGCGCQYKELPNSVNSKVKGYALVSECSEHKTKREASAIEFKQKQDAQKEAQALEIKRKEALEKLADAEIAKSVN